MADEGLLIGQEQAGKSAIQQPTEITSISVFGEFPDGAFVEQQFKMNLPRAFPHDQVALVVWESVSKYGGLAVVGSAGEYNWYPLHNFRRLTMKIGNIVGVTLG
jgi:hypothetical protein